MNRLILTIALLLGSIASAFAQDGLFEAFLKKASDSFVTVSYEYSTKLSGVNTIGDGTFSIQGSSYYHFGSGLEMWCDGSTVWTADPSVKEMVIETVSELSSPFAANPTLVLVSPDSSFEVVSVNKASESTEYSLKPKVACGVKDCKISFSGDKASPVIKKAVLVLDDGTTFNMIFKDVKFSSELKDDSFFRPGELGPSWVVTDLR